MSQPTFVSTNKGFTLIEVLLVLLLVSMVFNTVLLVVKEVGGGALDLKKQAEELKSKAFLSFRLKHQLESLYRNLALKFTDDGIYLGFVTALGEVYHGVVKVRYRFTKGKLYYCESFYTYDDLLSCEEGSEHFLTSLKDFKVRVFYRGKWFTNKNFYGRPEKVEVILNEDKILAEVWIGRRLP